MRIAALIAGKALKNGSIDALLVDDATADPLLKSNDAIIASELDLPARDIKWIIK